MICVMVKRSYLRNGHPSVNRNPEKKCTQTSAVLISQSPTSKQERPFTSCVFLPCRKLKRCRMSQVFVIFWNICSTSTKGTLATLPLHYSVMIMTDGRDPFAAASSPFGLLVLVNFSKPTDHHQSPRYCICWEGSPSTWTFKPHQLQPSSDFSMSTPISNFQKMDFFWTTCLHLSETQIILIHFHDVHLQEATKIQNGESAECLTCTNSHFGRKHWWLKWMKYIYSVLYIYTYGCFPK